MNKLCCFLIYFCGLYWQTAQAFLFVHPGRTLEWQHGTLASKILNNLADSHPHENVVFSPLSIHTAMTLLYLGAKGETAKELHRVLLPRSSNKAIIANDYGEFMKANLNRNISNFNLSMASALVVNNHFQIQKSFYPLAYNLSTFVTPADFSDGGKIVQLTNNFIETFTNSKIKDILKPGKINVSTIAVLVNALYLKALWQSPFSEESTRKEYFELESNKRVMVDMMFSEDSYRWATIPKLNATVLELPYENTDLTMLILLPDKHYGLKDLEKRIRRETINWNDISDTLVRDYVNVALPKFKIEFEMDVKAQFEKLGVSKLFSDSADLSDLFVFSGIGGFNEIEHKAYLEVNEAGIEGAAVTVAVSYYIMRPDEPKTIRVDRPFVFVIRNREAVFFIGHVAEP